MKNKIVSNEVVPLKYKGSNINVGLCDSIALEMAAEAWDAGNKFLPFNSAHEGYAVILEELDELWDEIKKKQSVRDHNRMRKEAIQAGAMAIRFVHDILSGKD